MNNYVPHGNKIKKINPEDFLWKAESKARIFMQKQPPEVFC